MSKPPKPPRPLLQKKSRCSSGDRATQASPPLLSVGPRFLGRLPIAVRTGALGNPKIVTPQATGPVGAEEETQLICGDGHVKLAIL